MNKNKKIKINYIKIENRRLGDGLDRDTQPKQYIYKKIAVDR